ncbi:MAG: hypothetical protein QNJ85_16905 [Gammaproteobacteria bacterium]|nr:hypothetical protein [Gammaproteobacteria bacterium]
MYRIISLLMLTLALGACSPSLPKDAAIEAMVRERVLDDALGQLFALDGFTRTNGFRESENVYIVDVEYDLVFQKSFIEVVREIRQNPTGPQYGMFGSRVILAAIQSNFGQFEAGDRLHKVEKYRLHNTEQGWQIAQ